MGRAVAWALSKTGILAARRKTAKNKVALICYPRVIPFAKNADTLPDDTFIRSDTLADHLEWISKRFEVIGLRDFCRRFLTGETFSSPKVIFAFQGGLLETHDVAAPLIDHCSAKAIAFLPPGVIGTTDRTPQERIIATAMGILKKRELLMRAFPDEGMPAPCEFIIELLVAVKRDKLFIELFSNQLMEMEPAVFEVAMEWFEHLAQSDQDQPPTHMSWQQVNALCEADWEIGCQGAFGSSLVDCTNPDAEFGGAYKEVLSHTGKPPVGMLYPGGEFDENVLHKTRRAGFLCGITGHPGMCDSATDLFTLPCVSAHQGNASTLPLLEKLIS